MKATAPLPPAKSHFQKTEVPCPYRYTPNGVYYALLKHQGKQKRASLQTTDKATAKRKLVDLQRDLGKVDASQGKMTLRELAARYLSIIQSQAATTVSLKQGVIERLLADLPLGADVQVSKIRPSDLEAWLASYAFGYSSYNHYVQVVKAVFALAVSDKALASSPAEQIKGKKVVKPIRVTPTFEEFAAIVADVRQQKWNAEAQASADFLEFMGLVGVGQAEITGLQRQHVYLAKSQITFFRQKTKTPYTVPIYPQVELLLKKTDLETRFGADKPTVPGQPYQEQEAGCRRQDQGWKKGSRCCVQAPWLAHLHPAQPAPHVHHPLH